MVIRLQMFYKKWAPNVYAKQWNLRCIIMDKVIWLCCSGIRWYSSGKYSSAHTNTCRCTKKRNNWSRSLAAGIQGKGLTDQRSVAGSKRLYFISVLSYCKTYERTDLLQLGVRSFQILATARRLYTAETSSASAFCNAFQLYFLVSEHHFTTVPGTQGVQSWWELECCNGANL